MVSMKRMYITLAAIFILIAWAVSCLGQKVTQSDQLSDMDRIKRRMELREEMHKRMREKLLYGIGPDDDLFKDLEQMFEESMSDSFLGFDQIKIQSENFKSEWEESGSGRTLIITPKDKDQKLNIDVSDSVITIKGETLQKTATSTFSSSFTNSFPVPDDCDGAKVKMDQKDGKILIQFPFKTGGTLRTPAPSPKVITPKKEERRPLPPSADDVTI